MKMKSINSLTIFNSLRSLPPLFFVSLTPLFLPYGHGSQRPPGTPPMSVPGLIRLIHGGTDGVKINGRGGFTYFLAEKRNTKSTIIKTN